MVLMAKVKFCESCGATIRAQPFFGYTSGGEYHWCCSIGCLRSEIHRLADKIRREENARIEYIC